ncbi:MAG: acyl-CoA dehydrogenase family protein [Myxococcota bacterium]|nr:acyl-CoA dehydrogenase family protein [Myxococcota bacterium]
MDEDTLISRAEALVPVLAERANEAEALRQMPKSTIDDLIGSGLTRALQPRAFGGSALGVATHVQLTSRLAAGCASTAWCQFVWSVHNAMLTYYPQATQEEVWADPETLTSASLAPVGKATAAEGGVRLSGKWSFASGCDAADWLLLGAVRDGGEGASGLLLCCVPKSEVEIVDNWHVAGLKGTGSKDVVVQDVFVPDHRARPFEETLGACLDLGIAVIAGPLLGAAEAALTRFRERLTQRVLITSLSRQSEMGSAKNRLAESSAEVYAARLLLERTAADIDARIAANRAPEPIWCAQVSRDTAFVAQLATRATQRVFEASGGGALQESEPIQRLWRDINAGHSHAYLNWDTAAEGWANAILAGGSSSPIGE